VTEALIVTAVFGAWVLIRGLTGLGAHRAGASGDPGSVVR
jgi:hypothetical protein